jgi:hypothetical protein
MTTKKQIISTIAIGAAFVAASTLMPDTASAWWWDRPRGGGGAPEVDPGTLSSALAIAVGGWAVLSDKLRGR